MNHQLELVDVIQRSLANKDDVLPLIEYLGMDKAILYSPISKEREIAKTIADYLRRMGSNDVATLFRGGEGVEYREVVLDVGRKLKAHVNQTHSVAKNEEKILLKIFEDSLERMTDDEKRAMFRAMGIDAGTIPIGPISTAFVQQILREYGGFYIYQISVVVANMIAKAVLGVGLDFATNAAITRTVGALLGPIGWLATGLWLAVDLAGPAYRKTVPAVIHVALLRSILVNRITIGVVGDGSSGKDSLLKAVFGLDSSISPIAGSTDRAVSYPLNKKGNAVIVNYPGFNDYRESVNKYTDDNIHNTDVFVMVIDINRGISGTDTSILAKLENFKRPILICLNKVDLAKSDGDLEKLFQTAKDRLGNYTLIPTAFDPDRRLGRVQTNARRVYDQIREVIELDGKKVDGDNFPPPPHA